MGVYKKQLEAQLCFQCGAMKWILTAKYIGTFHVREDGHIVFEEKFDDLEYRCDECGAWCLLELIGDQETFRELMLEPAAERILRALKLVGEGRLTANDVEPEVLLEWLEEYFVPRERSLREEKDGGGKMGRKTCTDELEDFISRARSLLGVWKLVG